MDLGLQGKTAIVCGASSGLGLAIAESLAAEGAKVVVSARRADVLAREAARLGAMAVPADLRDPHAPNELVAQCVNAFGGVDILVWNGGGPKTGVAGNISVEALQESYELLVFPLVRLIRSARPHLERSSCGRILAVSSIGVREPTPHIALSNAVRPGMHGYLKTLANELAPRGITVNVVAAGRINTSRMAQIFPNGVPPEQLKEIPMARWGRAQEFGDVVCFLASSRASYITGSTINVDGGLVRGAF
jgi:3-oxoacyl-[acyl-carrier protein] reductase